MNVDRTPAVENTRPIARHDRVRVPDGRIGEVIGFYRADDLPMLVGFARGDSQRYSRADLRPLGWPGLPHVHGD